MTNEGDAARALAPLAAGLGQLADEILALRARVEALEAERGPRCRRCQGPEHADAECPALTLGRIPSDDFAGVP